MALKGRIVVGQLTASVSSGTINITSGDLTDVDFGWIFCGSATALDTLTNHAAVSVGHFCRSGSTVDNQGCMNVFAENGVGSSDTERVMHNDRVIAMWDATGQEGELEATSFVTGGIQCTYRSAFSGAYRFFAVLIESDSSCKGTNDFDLNDAEATESFPNFKPDGVTAYGTTGSTSSSSTFKGFFGMAARDTADDSMDNVTLGFEIPNNSSTHKYVAGTNNTRIALRTSSDSNYYATYWTVDAVATGVTTDVSTTGRNLSGSRGLAWQMPTGQSFWVGREDGPVATGTKNITTSGTDDADVFMVFGCESNDSDAVAPSRQDGIFFGACDSQGNEACIAVLYEDGASTSVAKTIATNSATFLMYQDAATKIKEGDVTNLTGGSATFNFSTCDTNTWGYSWVAFEKEAVSGQTGSVTETVGNADVLAVTRALVASTTESVAMTEAPTPLANLLAALTESHATTDTAAALANVLASIIESVAANDATSAQVAKLASLIETLGVTESPSAIVSLLSSVAESLAMTDSAAGTVSGAETGAVTETFGLADALTTLASLLSTATESISASDTATAVVALLASVSESVGITDSVAGSTTPTVTVLESAGLTDAATALKGLVASITESFSISDAAAAVSAQAVTVIETIAMSDNAEFPPDVINATARLLVRCSQVARFRARPQYIAKLKTRLGD